MCRGIYTYLIFHVEKQKQGRRLWLAPLAFAFRKLRANKNHLTFSDLHEKWIFSANKRQVKQQDANRSMTARAPIGFPQMRNPNYIIQASSPPIAEPVAAPSVSANKSCQSHLFPTA